jgi:hypothetical protein
MVVWTWPPRVSNLVSERMWFPDHGFGTILFVGAVYPESLDIVETEPTDMAMRPGSMFAGSMGTPFCP